MRIHARGSPKGERFAAPHMRMRIKTSATKIIPRRGLTQWFDSVSAMTWIGWQVSAKNKIGQG